MIVKEAPIPLAIPVIFWLLGLGIGYFVSFHIAVYVSLFIFSAVLFFLLRRNYAMVLIIIMLTGMMHMRVNNSFPPRHLANLIKDNKPLRVTITGKIERLLRISKYQHLYYCELDSLEGGKCTGMIKLSSSQKLNTGDLIKTDIILEKPERPRNPGAKDWQIYDRVKGVFGNGKIAGKLEIKGTDRSFWQKTQAFIKYRLTQRLGANSIYARAMFIGDTSEISYDYRKSLQRAGLSHLFAISGLHVGIMAMVLYYLLRLLFRRKTSHNLLLLILIAYGFLCNWLASVTRAIVMYIIYRFSSELERPVNMNQIMAVAVFIITIFRPEQIFSTGFQLSVIATLVIINVFPLLGLLNFGKIGGKAIIKFFFNTTLITAAIVILLSPITISTFGGFSANAIIAIIPASLIFGIILPLIFPLMILPVGWQPFANAFHFLIGIFNRWVDFSASFPLYREGLQLNLMQTLGIYASLILAYFLIIKKRYFLIVISILLICGILIFPISTEEPGKDILRISCLDCGQGDLSFLELPGGEKILIDMGPPSELSGKEICLLRWLQKRRLRAIDYVIITHAHNDHYGGLPEVFGALDVKCLITDASFWNDIEDIEIENVISSENCRKITLQDTFKMELGDVMMRFIHPARDFTETDANNNSLVLMLQYRKFRALFTGDIEKEAEAAILENYGNGLKADFLKVPHHGSLSSSTSEFIKAVNPEVCFIPAGKNNRFGFPDRLVRNRYNHLKDGRIIAAEDGAMILETDGISFDYKVMLRD